jgi:hypothetical protein
MDKRKFKKKYNILTYQANNVPIVPPTMVEFSPQTANLAPVDLAHEILDCSCCLNTWNVFKANRALHPSMQIDPNLGQDIVGWCKATRVGEITRK